MPPRSISKARSRATRARPQSRWRSCAVTPTRRSRRTTSATAWCCSARSSRLLRTKARTGFASPAPPCCCGRRTSASAANCWSAPRPPPTSPISAPATATRKPTASPCSAGPTASAASGGPRSMRCGCRSSCARWPTPARSMRRCARTTASAWSTIRSTRMRRRRAPASSSPSTFRPSAPTSRRSWPSPAWTSPRCPPRTSSSASRASGTASATA